MSSPFTPSTIVSCLAAAGLLAGSLTASAQRGGTADAAAASVRFTEAREVPPKATLRLPARTAPAETALIYSRTSGIVAERLVDLGDMVQRGDLLARISAPEIGHEHAGALAEIDQAKAELALARSNLRRAESLLGKGHVSQAQLDSLRAAVSVAMAEVRMATAKAERLAEILGFQEIRAPMNGRIVERRVERGDRVNGNSANDTRYLFRIARLDELRIEVDVPQIESLRLKTGMPAILRFVELPGETLKAAIARTSGTIDGRTGTMRIELRLPNPDLRLPAGIRGEVQLDTSAPKLVAVPMNALLIRDGKPHVAVRIDNRLHFREVSVAYSTDREVFIRKGLSAGEQVARSPNALLVDGELVVATN